MDHSEVKHFQKVDHTPAELDETSRILLKAAALIEEKGHSQGTCGPGPQGPFCIISAIFYANGTRFSSSAEKRIAAAVGNGYVRWSDTSPAATVIAKLRAVALGL